MQAVPAEDVDLFLRRRSRQPAPDGRAPIRRPFRRLAAGAERWGLLPTAAAVRRSLDAEPVSKPDPERSRPTASNLDNRSEHG
ncbi:MAG: hypothetical protein MZV70_19910 [Desulfobacterales bacterium]|nr:hypothetical protein [Desulfobacterales bacterium]